MIRETGLLGFTTFRVPALSLALLAGLAGSALVAQSSSPGGVSIQVKANDNRRGVPSRISVENAVYTHANVATLDNGFWTFTGLQCTRQLKFVITPNDRRAYQTREFRPDCRQRLNVILVEPIRS